MKKSDGVPDCAFPAADSAIRYRAELEELYSHYHHRSFVHPDPLEFVYHFDAAADMEVTGLIASSLAYGRVAQILKSVNTVLEMLEYRPRDFIMRSDDSTLGRLFSHFVHRFTTGSEMTQFLINIRHILNRYGSLERCFTAGYKSSDISILPALSHFVRALSGDVPCKRFSLLASPDDGSACKRQNLFLRWMVRRDTVDPGCWEGISPSKLIVPLDTHMFSLSRTMDFTRQRCANLRTAVEITDSFRLIAPDDPVKYDFSLTRLGIRNDEEASSLKDRLFPAGEKLIEAADLIREA